MGIACQISGPKRGMVAGCLASLALLAASGARADVIAIGPGGQITTYSGPTLFTPEGATPLTRQPETAPPPAPATRDAGSAPPMLAGALRQAAERFGLSPALMEAVAWQESRFRQDAVSPKGAIGIMQLMPDTARSMGVNPHDTLQNIHGGAAYLRAMLDRFGGDVRLALAAYNAGPGAVERHRGVPPFRETREYVTSIAGRLSLP